MGAVMGKLSTILRKQLRESLSISRQAKGLESNAIQLSLLR